MNRVATKALSAFCLMSHTGKGATPGFEERSKINNETLSWLSVSANALLGGGTVT